MVLTLSASLFAGIASAQYAGGNGRALDVNVYQNTPSQNIINKLNHGNNIVTGNVGGLSYFHGNVGYVAPGAFQGSLQSTDLFRFRALSVPTNTYGALNRNTARNTIFNALQGTTVQQLKANAPSTIIGLKTPLRYATYESTA